MLANGFDHLSFRVFLLLLATEVKHHLGSLILGVSPSNEGFLLLGFNNTPLLIQSVDLMIHTLDREQFFLQKLL